MTLQRTVRLVTITTRHVYKWQLVQSYEINAPVSVQVDNIDRYDCVFITHESLKNTWIHHVWGCFHVVMSYNSHGKLSIYSMSNMFVCMSDICTIFSNRIYFLLFFISVVSLIFKINNSHLRLVLLLLTFPCLNSCRQLKDNRTEPLKDFS